MSAGDSGYIFVDTNVLLYSLDANEANKQAAAAQWVAVLWSRQAGRISWQVIHEFYAKAVQKLGVPVPTARMSVDQLMEWNPLTPHSTTLRRAWHWCDVAQLNFWDALIVAAAEQAGCQWLLSEDFQAGRKFGSVTVVNPFEHAPEEFEPV